MTFDIKSVRHQNILNSKYIFQIDRMKKKNQYVENIEKTVEKSMQIITDKCRSFIIYGEPQSGKTEMMIALTSRLLDSGFKTIIILIIDSVELLTQNLERFRRASLNPAPKSFDEIFYDKTNIEKDSEYIIFVKKNLNNLQSLLEKFECVKNKVIVDDEADYATPNSKINTGDKTSINCLVERLIGDSGIYIGVTATPERLDLNSTFMNDINHWVKFSPHPFYNGKNTFFPEPFNKNDLSFSLDFICENVAVSKQIRKSLFEFLINVAHLNLNTNDGIEKNYSMLIHTSRLCFEHNKNFNEIVKTFNILCQDDKKSKEYYDVIYNLAKNKYPGQEDDIMRYIDRNKKRHTILIMNNETNNKNASQIITGPSTLFTIIIGGNVISRGVTFDNLLSMFFTRDSKYKIQQDIYIQRARMFGARKNYLSHFTLHIPEKLYFDWHKCFLYQQRSLELLQKKGKMIWMEDDRISIAQRSSINNKNVETHMGNTGNNQLFLSNKIGSEKYISMRLDSKNAKEAI